ncbi:hypothetical protein PSA01_61470 [Pseudonocardia saturnea]|uniref:Helix-turn-helix domain-containing protein n=1 Tax=Pseudonocardia saturnea TaxID=33909 RepID=A0ABQ0S871_9PSEU|nr:hypothetical protein PSA01_61470 [Pseudonocardia saturnea]
MLADRWASVVAGRVVRRATAVLLLSAAAMYGVYIWQLALHLTAYLATPGAVYPVDGSVLQWVGTALLVPGYTAIAVFYLRTALGAAGPGLSARLVERVTTPSLRQRFAERVALATVAQGGSLVLLVLAVGDVVAAHPAPLLTGGVLGVVAAVVALRWFRSAGTAVATALARHATGAALVGTGTVAAGAAAWAGAAPAGTAVAVGAGLLTVGVGVGGLTGAGVRARHPAPDLGRWLRALPQLPVVLARRLLTTPAALAELRVAIGNHVRFRRTSEAVLPLPYRPTDVWYDVVAAGDRYVVHSGLLVDTVRLWRDWERLAVLRQLPADLTRERHRAVTAAHAAGLTVREIARLFGSSSATVRHLLRHPARVVARPAMPGPVRRVARAVLVLGVAAGLLFVSAPPAVAPDPGGVPHRIDGNGG